MEPSSSSSTTTSRSGLRSTNLIYILNETIPEILGSKLPSKKEVLQLLLHHTTVSNLEIKVAAKKIVDPILYFWSGAEIPTMEPHNIVKKIVKLCDAYKLLERSSKNRLQKDTNLFKNRELDFIFEMNNLFDIASSNLSEASENAIQILYQQRQTGRPGNILFRHVMTGRESDILGIECRKN